MSNPAANFPALNLRSITYPAKFETAEQTAADELARLTGAEAWPAARPGKGLNLALASRKWAPDAAKAAKDHASWIWLRVDENGAGEIIATEGSGLFAAARLLANGLTGATREKLAKGLL